MPRDNMVGPWQPLNRPSLMAVARILSEGYSFCRPPGRRHPAEFATVLVRSLICGDAGIDPYTRELSDVYQDVIHGRSFIGAGILRVDAFQPR